MSTYPHMVMASLLGPDVEALGAWLASQLPGVELCPIHELNDDRSEQRFYSYRDERFSLWVQEHTDLGWLEVTIWMAEGETFADLDNLRFGELLVDALDGQALVDCGGRYTDPSSDEFVRVTRERVELVDAPALDEIDERWTKQIRRRES